MPGSQNRDRLINAMFLVFFEVIHPALLDQLHDPTRIQVDTKADSLAVLGEMLDGKSQTSRPTRPEHQPVRTLGKIFVRKGIAEQLVIGPVILDYNATFRNSRRSAGFKHVSRLVGVPFWNPPSYGATTQPLVFKMRKFFEIVKRLHISQRIEFKFSFLLKPEGASGILTKMPMHRFQGMFIESIPGI